jgi:LacI family transcriptional regulator
VYNGILAYIEKQQWHYILDPFFDPARRADDGVDGIISRASRQLVKSSQKAGIPLVNVQHHSAAFGTVPSVIPDYRDAGRLAAEHLMSRGFRHFGVLGYQRDRSQKELQDGFTETLQREGLSCEHVLLVPWGSDRQEYAWRQFRQDVEEWMQTWETPIGVFSNRDLLARYAIEICQDMQINVPGDAGFVATETCPYMCTHRNPTVTSIDLAFERVGEEAAALLGRMIKGESVPHDPIRIKPAGLIPRQTTEYFAIEDPLVAQAMRYMRDHCEEALTVSDIADAVHATRRTVERRFRQQLSSSVIHELGVLRVEKARQLLADTDMLIKQVAIATGFRETRRLNEVFRKIEGCLPSEYRSRWKPEC